MVADDVIDPLYFSNRGSSDLRVAPDHYRYRPRICADEAANDVAGLGIGLVGHGTGVDDAEVGRLAKWDNLVACSGKTIGNCGNLVLVKATAQGSNGRTLGLSVGNHKKLNRV